jgi:SpoVK/Ycf46/Vps4 family AAA+-type ATPase
VQGRATVVFCDARTVANAVRYIYRQLEYLAPALVIMEDVDLVLADRHGGGGAAPLNDFLLALDGAMTQHSGVVTIATTNDVDAIDPAARRAARFDRVVTVPPPDRDGRAAILERYLRGVDDERLDVDVGRVAAATDGATGADLRELVTRAVLHVTDSEVALDTALLLSLVTEGDAHRHPGLYL